MSFDTEIARLLSIEAGYVNNPNDPGGATNYGITEAVARAFGYQGRMEDFPLDVARQIYKARYWDPLKLDAVDPLVPTVASELFDCSVNMGVGVAGTFLQQALNVMNDKATKYPDITVDGLVGNTTVATLKAYLAAYATYGTAEIVLLRAIVCLRGARYIAIAKNREASEEFEFGWFNKRIRLS